MFSISVILTVLQLSLIIILLIIIIHVIRVGAFVCVSNADVLAEEKSRQVESLTVSAGKQFIAFTDFMDSSLVFTKNVTTTRFVGFVLHN